MEGPGIESYATGIVCLAARANILHSGSRSDHPCNAAFGQSLDSWSWGVNRTGLETEVIVKEKCKESYLMPEDNSVTRTKRKTSGRATSRDGVSCGKFRFVVLSVTGSSECPNGIVCDWKGRR